MISIREATQTDISTLVDFQQRLADESEGVKLDGTILRAGLQAMFDDPAKGIYYIVEDGVEVIGCHLITYEWSDWRNGLVWWLQSVYVKESHRQKGIFKLMYDNVIRMINADPNLLGLRLYVDKTNARAIKVYEAMGMDGSHYTVFEWMK
jgi:ribosomal protein S18 acetylase RimI-like enzyme